VNGEEEAWFETDIATTLAERVRKEKEIGRIRSSELSPYTAFRLVEAGY